MTSDTLTTQQEQLDKAIVLFDLMLKLCQSDQSRLILIFDHSAHHHYKNSPMFLDEPMSFWEQRFLEHAAAARRHLVIRYMDLFNTEDIMWSLNGIFSMSVPP